MIISNLSDISRLKLVIINPNLQYYKIILLSVFLIIGKLKAQISYEKELKVQSYSIQNGLPSNNINFVFQDYKGFIWIGTYTGLSKFNGYQFTNFLPNPNKEYSIKVGHYITYLKVSDSIYYLTTKLDGIQKLNIENNTLNRLKNSPSSPKNITKDKDGTFWIGTLADGFYHYFPQTQKCEKILFKELTNDFNYNWDNNTVNEICIDKKNDSLIWLGSRKGLYSYNKLTGNFRLYKVPHKLEMQEFALNQITSLLMDDDGNIWAGKYFGGLGKLTIKTNQWEHYYFSPEAFKFKVLNTNIVDNLRLINSNTLIISTSNGPMQFDIKNKKFTKFNLINKNNKLIGDVIDWYIDKDGNQWFSNCYQNGLAFASKRLNSIKKVDFPKQTFKPDYYSSNIMDMYWSQFHQKYFIANNNHDGLLIYNKNFELLNQILIPNNWKDKEPFPTSIGEDNQGDIWLTDITNQLMFYNQKLNIVQNYKTDLFKYCYQIIRGENNEIYFNTEKGLFLFFNKKFSIIIKKSNNYIFSNIQNGSINFIDNLSLFSFNLKSKSTTKIIEIPKFAIENGNYIQNVFKDKNNRLWIPLEFGGIYFLKENSKDIELLSFDEGLNNNTVRDVKEDKNGNIFIICNGGLFYYDLNSKTFVDIDNLTNQETKDWYEHALYFSEENEIIVSKENSFYLIDIITVLNNRLKVPYITDLYSKNFHQVNAFNNLTLPNNQNDVKLFFTNFDYSFASEIVFEYTLVGLNNEWIKLDKGVNFVSFTNLDEGKYVFKIRVKGQQEYTQCQFKITVIWYKSKKFYFALFVLFFSGIIGSLYYYNNKKTKESNLQKRIAELKLTALQSQLNPHFLFNCLTSISGLIKTKEYDKSEMILNNFAKLMRSILSNSSKDLITLEEEIEFSKIYLQIEKLRKDDNFNFQINLPDNLKTALKVPPLILQPYLENSIKHGFLNKDKFNKGNILVDISFHDNCLSISIIDNGIGIQKSKLINSKNSQHKSMGMEIQNERLLQYYNTHQMSILINQFEIEPNGTNIEIKITYN